MSTFGDANQTGGGSAVPAGWYPVDDGSQRYWDGTGWIEHVAPGPGPTPWHPQEISGGQGLAGPNTPFGQPEASAPPFSSGTGGGWYPSAGQQVGFQGHGQAPYRGTSTSADERSMGMLMHVLALVSGFIGPLVLWLVKKNESPFIDHNGKQALNFQLSLLLYWFGVIISFIFLIGILLFPVLLVVQILFPIKAAIAANRGERYSYPMTIPFIS